MELTCSRMNLAVFCKWMMRVLSCTKLIWVILVYRNDHDWIWWTALFGLLGDIEGIILVVIFAAYILTFVNDFEVENSRITV